VVSRSWIQGRTDPVPVYRGEKIERVVDGFNLVHAADEVYRRAHHGESCGAQASDLRSCFEERVPRGESKAAEVAVGGQELLDAVVQAQGGDTSVVDARSSHLTRSQGSIQDLPVAGRLPENRQRR
jgi:hypothetical protein